MPGPSVLCSLVAGLGLVAGAELGRYTAATVSLVPPEDRAAILARLGPGWSMASDSTVCKVETVQQTYLTYRIGCFDEKNTNVFRYRVFI